MNPFGAGGRIGEDGVDAYAGWRRERGGFERCYGCFAFDGDKLEEIEE